MDSMATRKPLTPAEAAMTARLKAIWGAKHKELGLTQEKAAQIMGFDSQSTVSQYLLGRMRLNFDAIMKFSRLLGCLPTDINPDLATLLDGTRETIVANAEFCNEEQKQIPILLPEDVADWLTRQQLQPRASEGIYMTGLSDLPENAFALRISGNSMEPEFREGDEILINPAMKPDPGMFCAAQAGDKIVFRKLRVIGVGADGQEIFELVPLNGDFPTLRNDTLPITILGKVVESKKRY